MKPTTDPEKYKLVTGDSVRVIASFRAKPGKHEALKQILASLVEPTRAEPGCIAYILHQDANDNRHFVFDEIWVNMQALKEHSAKPYILALPQKLQEIVSEPPRVETFYEVSS
ncbi:putative quinol monooxygenase [Nitrososphaera viennensis]|uniref:Antibiotic biosynthesis monooxygenase n=1 Tax=Nitrososphaera viennensis TaxID=1034015 RepID=A0A977IEW1_9ARCH|nr:putative quinol monooxygenase [Nitrososphaera viennensis]UVS69751.1 antibiotic biosynthesis monooxygenase [Nitrososphaera viennensis]